eukprot:5894456-Pleurochrysis_carterae.AAC.1
MSGREQGCRRRMSRQVARMAGRKSARQLSIGNSSETSGRHRVPCAPLSRSLSPAAASKGFRRENNPEAALASRSRLLP